MTSISLLAGVGKRFIRIVFVSVPGFSGFLFVRIRPVKNLIALLSREEYMKIILNADESCDLGMVAFESLQGLKGSVYFGGEYDKLAWMAKEYKDLSGPTVIC